MIKEVTKVSVKNILGLGNYSSMFYNNYEYMIIENDRYNHDVIKATNKMIKELCGIASKATKDNTKIRKGYALKVNGIEFSDGSKLTLTGKEYRCYEYKENNNYVIIVVHTFIDKNNMDAFIRVMGYKIFKEV